jgi:tetratricopeptide (TPR) repeat protein
MSTRPNLDAASPNDRLDSWKEIAAYLGRSERTVRRWEEREALPVHRLAHEKRGSIYAYRSEVDSWRASRKQLLEADAPEPGAPDASPSVGRQRETPKPASWVHSRSMLWTMAGAAAALLVLLVWLNFWARKYERNLSDVIALQNELAQVITNEIQVKLTPDEQTRRRRESVDPQAHEYYVTGTFFVNKRNRASILKGIGYYQQAIQRDPKYAAAYAAMARAYTLNTGLSQEERCSRQRDLAGKALELDEGLADAHAASAARFFLCDWDWAGAEREYERALALNPSDAGVRQGYGQLLNTLGRQNWVSELKHALELDPVSLNIAGGNWYLDSGQFDLFIERQNQRMELDASSPGPYSELARGYAKKGLYEKAIENHQKAIDLSGGAPDELSRLGYTYGLFDKRKEALKILDQLTLSNARPDLIARVYLGLGENDRAFEYLHKAVADHSIWPPTLRSREMNSIRSDPRYAELLRGVGLEP